MQCTNCTQELIEGSLFCDGCGNARATMIQDEGTLRLYCGKCGTKLKGHKKYCVQCGEPSVFAGAKKKDNALSQLLNNPKLLLALVGVCAAIIVLPLFFLPKDDDERVTVKVPKQVLEAAGAARNPDRFRAEEISLDQLRLAGLALRSLSGVVRDVDGSTYVSDSILHLVYKLGADGKSKVYAGTGEAGFSGDYGPAGEAMLNKPRGLTLDEAGNLYIADSGNQVVRMVDRRGEIRTIAGQAPQEANTPGQGLEAARRVGLMTPTALGVGMQSEIYVTEDPNAAGERKPTVWILEPEYE